MFASKTLHTARPPGWAAHCKAETGATPSTGHNPPGADEAGSPMYRMEDQAFIKTLQTLAKQMEDIGASYVFSVNIDEQTLAITSGKDAESVVALTHAAAAVCIKHSIKSKLMVSTLDDMIPLAINDAMALLQ